MCDDPKCPACGVAWRDHAGPTAMCEEIQRLTEERDCARKSLRLAYLVLRLTIPRPHGCLCDKCLEALQEDDTIGTYQQLMRLTAQCAGRAATIRRLLAERESLINGDVSDCIHCGEIISGADHWRTCSKHPANAEIERLNELLGHYEEEAILPDDVDEIEAAACEPFREIIERIMTAHWDLASCRCWVCTAGREAGCRPREEYQLHRDGNRERFPVPANGWDAEDHRTVNNHPAGRRRDTPASQR
jgi:hypothetical protein